MSWRTNGLVLAARNFGRTIGINKQVAKYLNRGGYEINYDNMLSAELSESDCVWDVGANVGYYTRLFLRQVGDSGMVVAFEPSPANFKRLISACNGLKNVSLYQFGLGYEDARLSFREGCDELGATSRVTESPGEEDVQVNIRSGLNLIRNGSVCAPNVIKIDVEGYEYEVLQGLGDQLCSPLLRAIGIEVHFRILKERGMARVPQLIEKLLDRNGFIMNWADSSHIIATRRSQ